VGVLSEVFFVVDFLVPFLLVRVRSGNTKLSLLIVSFVYPARTLISPVNRQNVVHLRRLGKNVGIGKIVGFVQPFVSEPKEVEARFVPVQKPAMSPFLSANPSLRR